MNGENFPPFGLGVVPESGAGVAPKERRSSKQARPVPNQAAQDNVGLLPTSLELRITNYERSCFSIIEKQILVNLVL